MEALHLEVGALKAIDEEEVTEMNLEQQKFNIPLQFLEMLNKQK